LDGADSAEARIALGLARVFLAGLAGLLLLGAAFVFQLRPGVPEPDLLSGERWLALGLPFLALVAIVALASRGLGHRLGNPARTPTLARRLAPGAIAVVGCGYALQVPDTHVSVLFLLTAPAAAALVATHASGRSEPLLAGLPLLALGLPLFALELPTGHTGEHPVRWGGPRTFATVFPRAEPFLGEGGRLRPNLDLHMASAERLRGATVRTDSRGFRNTLEVAALPAAGELRILSLGDSFSIGMQIDQDAFLGPRLEAELARSEARPVRVLNAEVSDPAYGLHYLQRHGLRFRPEIVLYGLCANDMLQAALRFGPDRLFALDAGGLLVANPDAPATGGAAEYHDWVYPAVSEHALSDGSPSAWRRAWGGAERRVHRSARKLAGSLLRFRALEALDRDVTRTTAVPMWSYAREVERRDGRLRLLDGTVNLAYFAQEPPPVLDDMYERLFTLLRAMDRSVRESGGRFVLVVHPQRFQVDPADWRALADYWGLADSDFDLERYDRRLASFCRANGIPCLDLLTPFRQEAGRRALYLPRGDMHYNRAGHALAAAALADFLRAGLLEPPAAASPRAASLTHPADVRYVR
jgi:hypothetical protein